MIDFPIPKTLVLACHITGIYDVNRSSVLPDDDYSLVKDWAESLTALSLHGIIFHNNFSDATCKKYQNEFVHFVKIAYAPPLNPNVFRYSVYRDFLLHAGKNVESLFITDVSDVVVVKNPFTQDFFLKNPTSLFCGNEPKHLQNDWMQAHSSHFRSKIADYEAYETKCAAKTLLNCGVVGGKNTLMLAFLRQLSALHERYNTDNQTAYTGDMGAFNYIVYTQFEAQLHHGAPVNTIFKGYEMERNDCWFRHK